MNKEEWRVDENVHIIWGNSSFSKNRVNVLKMNGMTKIYVLDEQQKTFIQEENDVIYISKKYAPLLKRDEPGKVHHFFMYVSPDEYESRGKKGKLDSEENS